MTPASERETATYLYCLVPRERAPALGRAPRGLPGTGPVRAIEADGGLWLVAADAPLSRYGAAAVERGLKDLDWVSACALAHEAVIEHCARAGTALPMKLFTMFSTDERARAHIARLRPGLGRIVKAVSGRQEWGVRIRLDAGEARARVRERAAGSTRAATSGTRFLLLKKQEQQAVRDALEQGRSGVDAAYETLAGLADDARRRPPDAGDAGARLVLDAAFLVAPARLARFKAAARKAAVGLAPHGYALTLSGPWPPYHFVTGLA
ncbi:MAG TPA: GvpL/GvpF family gas vesicle protein [Candidatus Limnocylindria bacterium]|nr:GvpL/GvpF family gas vesicle protein [Candidatus Limnocylindria bacterium]